MLQTKKTADTTLGTVIARWILFCLALGVCVFIFLNSAANAEESGGESILVTEAVARLFVGNFSDLPAEEQVRILGEMHGHVRTAAHFSEYALLGFFVTLFLLSFDRHFRPSLDERPWKYAAGFGFCALYAVSDEIHQIFVDGRVADAADVLVDSLGALTGGIAAFLVGFLISVALGRSVRKKRNLSDKNP